MSASLVGSEMCIRDSCRVESQTVSVSVCLSGRSERSERSESEAQSATAEPQSAQSAAVESCAAAKLSDTQRLRDSEPQSARASELRVCLGRQLLVGDARRFPVPLSGHGARRAACTTSESQRRRVSVSLLR
eukprot:4860374-Alexandrium_andersonii.AAC.1